MVDLLSSPGDVLSIALHISLLEVGRKPVQVLIIGQQGVRLSTKEVAIPDAKDCEVTGRLDSMGAVRKWLS